MRNRIEKLLANHGYETVQASDGHQAVTLYCQRKPDAVLMDITMPRMDGLSALTRICQLDTQAVVIMLTALDQEMAAARAIHLGAKDFLAKPVPPNRLLAALDRALGAHR
jgi:two-component system chemotaxis response regulator CheY